MTFDTSLYDLLKLSADLAYFKYDKLGLEHLEPLRIEVKDRLHKLVEEGKKPEEINELPSKQGPSDIIT